MPGLSDLESFKLFEADAVADLRPCPQRRAATREMQRRIMQTKGPSPIANRSWRSIKPARRTRFSTMPKAGSRSRDRAGFPTCERSGSEDRQDRTLKEPRVPIVVLNM